MHIGIVTSSISRNAGGLYDAVRFLSAHIAKHPDTKVSVFGLEDSATEEDLSGWHNCSVNYFTTKGPSLLGYAPMLKDNLLAADLDLVHQHGLWTMVSNVTLAFRKTTGRPVIISPHGMLDDWALHNSFWKKRAASFLYEGDNLRSASCIHALCKSEAASIESLGLTNPIHIIPNGVEVQPAVSKQEKPRKKLLFLGRLHPKKGLENLLAAWRAVAPQDWALAIAGTGDDDYVKRLKNVVDTSKHSVEFGCVMPKPFDERDCYERPD